MAEKMFIQDTNDTSIPVDTEDMFWLVSENYTSLADIIQAVKEKWPDLSLEDVTIEAVHHHQYSIHYDLHDSSDYVDYLLISRNDAKAAN